MSESESERHVWKGRVWKEGYSREGKGRERERERKRAGRVLAPPRILAGAGWKEAYAGSVGGLSIE